MRFEFVHDLPLPLPIVEEALRRPELAAEVHARVPGLDAIELKDQHVDEGELWRIWRFQAHPHPVLRSLGVPRDWFQWDEHTRYRLREHEGQWHLYPRPDAPSEGAWRARFHSEGTYRLEAPTDRATRRTVTGCFDLQLGFASGMLERAALSELRKVYAAEAVVLGELGRQT